MSNALPVIPIAESWMDEAICAQTDPELFFPEKGGSTLSAKTICDGCQVVDECLDYALRHDERFGIWGGLSERERRKLKRSPIGAVENVTLPALIPDAQDSLGGDAA